MENQHCTLCGHPLRFRNVALVLVAGWRYHSLCWVMCGAPSVQAPVYPCGVN